jgi:hypothetical protein
MITLIFSYFLLIDVIVLLLLWHFYHNKVSLERIFDFFTGSVLGLVVYLLILGGILINFTIFMFIIFDLIS